MKITHQLVNALVVCLAWPVLLMAVFAGGVMATDDTAKVTNLKELKQLRKKAAHRRRRIIFNNDGNEPVYFCRDATPEALLECRTTGLIGLQVDTIFYCTWCSGFGNFTHNTKVGEIFTCKESKLANNKVGEFIRRGTDPLEIMVKFCRKHDMEIFWSLRMNDTHDVSTAWYGPLLFPQLKKDHPEWLLGSKTKRTKHGRWTAVDYGRQEIRDLAYRYVEEVCRNYDVDGVELDFFRHLNYFKRPAMGQDAGQEERDMMTGLVRRIRKMTETVGLNRGHPILVAVRVPDSVDYCAAMGFDVVRWLKEDLIDVLVVSGYFRLNPWEVSVRLGHKYGVPVYPCLSESRISNQGQSSKARRSVACYRARAMNVWDSGADGVYLFNLFNPRSPVWRELGDPQALQTMDKVYCTGARGVRTANSWLKGGTRFLNRSPLSPQRPVPLKPGKTATVQLRVGEDVHTPKAGGTAPDVKLQIRVAKLADADHLSVKLNGQPFSAGKKSGEWLEYPVSPAQVTKGANRFEITLKPGSTAKPILQDLLLWVRDQRSR